MESAWREVKDNQQFERILEMVSDVTEMGLEVCCTLGMLNESQAKRLEDAGLYAYNHNIDTSERFYETIITTRKFADRLNTIEQVRKTNVTVCSGGIIGMGETIEDRLSMLHTLATMRPHPESVPINILAKVPGTPMGDRPDLPDLGNRSNDRAGATTHAGERRAPLCGAGAIVGKRSGLMLYGRGEFDFLKRQRPDADDGRAVAEI